MNESLYLTLLLSAQDGISSVLESVGGKFGPVGEAIAGATIAAVGFGAESVKMAGDFQQSTTTLVTSAGETSSNLDMVRQGILKMATDTGTSTDQLVQGMYMIESAGFHGADGLKVLQAAAEGARAEGANLDTVGNAVTTMLTDYHMSADQAASATNALVATTSAGKTHMEDLAGSMGTILPIASALGISFPQVAGAIATMTDSGMSAQRASQNLAFAIRALAAPNGKAANEMDYLHLSVQGVKDSLTGPAGLGGAIQMITDAIGKKFPAGSVGAVTAFKTIMGGAVGYNVALMLGGQNMAAYQDRIKSISAAMNAGGTSVMGWSDIQGNFNFKIAQAQQALNVLMIQIGTALLPVVSQLLGAVVPLISQFSSWITSSGILQNVTNAISSAFSAMQPILALIGTLFAKLFPPVDAAAKAVASVAKAATPVIGAFNSVGDVSDKVYKSLTPVIGAFNNVGDISTKVYNAVQPVATTFTKVGDVSDKMYHSMGPVIGAFNNVGDVSTKMYHALGPVAGTFDSASTTADKMYHAMTPVTNSLITAYNVMDTVVSVGKQLGSVFQTNLMVPLQGLVATVAPLIANAGKLIQQIIQWAIQNDVLGKAVQVVGFIIGVLITVIGIIINIITVTIKVIEVIIAWFIKWHAIIGAVVIAILTFFGPAILIAGTWAVITGAKIAASFIASMIQSGIQAVINAAKITASFVQSMIEMGWEAWLAGERILTNTIPAMIQSGIQAVVNGAKVTASFVGSMIQTGAAAVANAAKVTVSFIGSMIASGTAAVVNGAKVVGSFVASIVTTGTTAVVQAAKVTSSFIASMIATGTQAVIAAAKVVGSFVASLITTAAQAIATAATFMVTLIPAIISFVAEALVAAATAIPAVLAGFGAWIVGAAAVAIANIIAFWPIYLIVAAIVIVIGLVVLAVQHWGAISTWVANTWKAVSDWFTKSFWPVIVKGWNTFVNWLKGFLIAVGIVLFVIVTGPLGLIVLYMVTHWAQVKQLWTDAMNWLTGLWRMIVAYAHAYWSMFIFVIQYYINLIETWIMDKWTAIVTWIRGMWNLIINYVRYYWSLMNWTINYYVNLVVAWLMSKWNGVVTWFSNLWNQITTSVSNAWTWISNLFINAWNTYIINPLNGIWNNFVTWFNNLGQQFLQSGKNFIQMLVNGIVSGAGAIWNAVTGIAKNIWTALGFHSPAKDGPGKDADTWMPNLVNMLASGLTAGVPKIANAAQQLAQPLRTNLASPVSSSSNSSTTNAGGNHTFNMSINVPPGTTQQQAQAITDQVMTLIARNLRGQAITPLLTSGGH